MVLWRSRACPMKGDKFKAKFSGGGGCSLRCGSA